MPEFVVLMEFSDGRSTVVERDRETAQAALQSVQQFYTNANTTYALSFDKFKRLAEQPDCTYELLVNRQDTITIKAQSASSAIATALEQPDISSVVRTRVVP